MGEVGSVTLEHVLAAARRLHGVAHRTPLLRSRTLDERTGARVALKTENFQRMGAFKFRGAYNRIVQLRPDERARGVVAFSSGNHAQGVALAARLLDVPATIVMPSDAPVSKLEATRGYGAEVMQYDRHTQNRGEIAAEIARERGATLVPPYDDADIIAGQGTAALELLEDDPELQAIVVPVGGGGLMAGTILAAGAASRAVTVYGVEPAAGDDFRRSMQAGERVEIQVPQTIADGQQTTSPGRLNFEIARHAGARIVTVQDDEIVSAMRFAFERLKLVLEPSGASALAALLAGKLELKGARVGILLSGGNVDVGRFSAIVGHVMPV